MWRATRQAGLLGSATRALLIHDLHRMQQRIRMLHQAFPPSTLHALAIKANPVVEILRAAADAGAGLEAASIEEVQLGLAAGCPPERIVFDSPAKTPREIHDALRLGVYLNADNLEELNRIDAALRIDPNLRVGGCGANVGLRVNPEVTAGTISSTSVGSRGSKFGESIHSRREAIIDSFVRYPWLSGLHVHIGSQGCGLDSCCEAVARCAALGDEIRTATGRPLCVLDIGGGLPAAYSEKGAPPTPAEYARRLKEQVPSLFNAASEGDRSASRREDHRRHSPRATGRERSPESQAPSPQGPQREGFQLITEFGRCVQAGCGVALSRVEYVRDDPAMAVIHLGADFLLRPVYQPEHWRHEFFVLDAEGKQKTSPRRPVTLAGPLCFAGDIVARDVPLPLIEPGDWVVIRDTGAYTLSMWSHHCGRAIPGVVGYDQASEPPVRVLREAETAADVVAFWSRSRKDHREPDGPITRNGSVASIQPSAVGCPY